MVLPDPDNIHYFRVSITNLSNDVNPVKTLREKGEAPPPSKIFRYLNIFMFSFKRRPDISLSSSQGYILIFKTYQLHHDI